MPGIEKNNNNNQKKQPPPRRARTHARGPGPHVCRSPIGLGPGGGTPAAAAAATQSHTVRSLEFPEIPVAAARLAPALPIKQHRIRLKIFAKSALGPKINHSPHPDRVKTDA